MGKIINMNGRIYDPLTAQFFSPDPFIQTPSVWLNFNRFSYVNNNPFRYTDPTGEVRVVGPCGNLIVRTPPMPSPHLIQHNNSSGWNAHQWGSSNVHFGGNSGNSILDGFSHSNAMAGVNMMVTDIFQPFIAFETAITGSAPSVEQAALFVFAEMTGRRPTLSNGLRVEFLSGVEARPTNGQWQIHRHHMARLRHEVSSAMGWNELSTRSSAGAWGSTASDFIGLGAHGVQHQAHQMLRNFSGLNYQRTFSTVRGVAGLAGHFATGLNVAITATTVFAAIQSGNATTSTWVNVGVQGGSVLVAGVATLAGVKVVVPTALAVGTVWGIGQLTGGDAINSWIDNSVGNLRRRQ